MSTTCPECFCTFSRKDVMLRHLRNKHSSYPPPPPPPQIDQAYPPPPPPQIDQAYPPPPPPQINQAYPPPPLPQIDQAYPPPSPFDLPPPPLQINQAYPPSLSDSTDKGPIFTMKHPFTAVVTGPTSSGKSYFVAKLLQQARSRIEPPPQRVLWFFKRWQKLYDVIKATVYPRVDFIRDIPLDLEKDSFIDPNVRNLIVLDDLMSTLSKDPRINDLFTEGSHHRNLSVIAINQNLYYSKDPTQRRNCHYMVLFKNPVDKQPTMTLARQMHPENPGILLRHFDRATDRPYGYLLIDLKPTTPDHLRLKSNVFDENVDHVHNTHASKYMGNFYGDTIKGIEQTEQASVQKGEGWTKLPQLPRRQIVKHRLEDGLPGQLAKQTGGGSFPGLQSFTRKEMNSDQRRGPGNYFPCQDCGILFAYQDDVAKHKSNHCPEREDSEDEQPPRKKIKLEKKTSQTVQMAVWARLFRQPMSATWIKPIKKRSKRYMQMGYSKEESWDLARHDFIKDIRKDFRERYTQFLLDVYYLGQDPVQKKVMETVDQMRWENGMDLTEAIKMAIKTRKHYWTRKLFVTL